MDLEGQTETIRHAPNPTACTSSFQEGRNGVGLKARSSMSIAISVESSVSSSAKGDIGYVSMLAKLS